MTALARDVRRALAGHDLLLYAAGATFYLAVAYVPLLLLAVRLAAVVAGRTRVRTLGEAIAGLLPRNLGADDVARALVDAGSRLPWSYALLAVLPATLYGEGLRRALSRFSPGREGAGKTAWLGRLLTLLFIALSPMLTLAALFAAAALSDALGDGMAASVVGGTLGFLVAWVLSTAVLAFIFRAVAPERPGPRAVWYGAAGTGCVVAGVLVAFLVFLHIPVRPERAYGGFYPVGAAAIVGVWLFLLHLLVLIGYVATLRLDAGPRQGGAVN